MGNRKTTNHNHRIIAIDPGTREMGVVVVQGREILYYGVKSFKRRNPASVLLAQIGNAVEKLLHAYQPDVLVIEKAQLNKHNATRKLIQISKMIKFVAKQQRLKIVEYSSESVRKRVCKVERPTKNNMTNELCSKYPELSVYRYRKHEWKSKYWQNMFDALGLAVAYLDSKAVKLNIDQE